MDALERLHQGLVRERALVGTPYLDDPSLLAAYCEHFSPLSYAKADAVLREVCRRPPRRVIDAGAGAMAQAAHALFPAAEVLACDRSARALGRVPEPIRRVRWDLTEDAPAE